MNAFSIVVDGHRYPCRPTMGAMLRFKRETGREVTELDGKSVSDLCTYLYCCVVSAAEHAGEHLDMDLMTFADSISPEDMEAWGRELEADGQGETDEAGDEKKSRKASNK